MARRGPLQVRPDLAIPAGEIEVSYARSGGPGGQNVNKVESKVVLRFAIGSSQVLTPPQKERIRAQLASRITGSDEILVHADEYRDRARNLAAAEARLSSLLGRALEEREKRRPTRPTRSSARRRLEGKKRRADVKRGRRGDEA